MRLAAMDLRESGLLSTSVSLAVSSRSVAAAASRRKELQKAAEHLPPVDHLQQLRKWRSKASLLAQLAVRSELSKEAVPVIFPKRDFFGEAMHLYHRAWHLCKCFNIGGAEFAALAVEIGFLLHVQNDVWGALEMGAAAGHEELLSLCLRDLEQHMPQDQEGRERGAAALETVRGMDEVVLGVLRRLATGDSTACGMSLARFLARQIGLEQEPNRREALMSELRALGYLGAPVAKLIAEAGDVVLLVSRPEGGEPLRVRAARLALVEASEYFANLLAGSFAEGRESEVRIVSNYPEHLERAVHYLYVGDVEIANVTDAIEMLACALELQVPGLASYASSYLMQSDVDLDGDTLASVLLLLGDGHPTLRDRLVSKWTQTLVAHITEGAAPGELVELMGDSAWDMVMEARECDRMLLVCNAAQIAVMLPCLGRSASQKAIVALGTLHPSEVALAEFIEPLSYGLLPVLDFPIKMRLLQRLQPGAEDVCNIASWFGAVSAPELAQMVPELLRLPALLESCAAAACSAALAAGVDDQVFSALFFGGKLDPESQTSVFFDTVSHRNESCMRMIVGANPEVLRACAVRGSEPMGWTRAKAVRPMPSKPTFGYGRAVVNNDQCSECGIVQGHLTTCSTRKTTGKKEAPAPVVPAGKAPTSRDTLRQVMSMAVFPLIRSTRCVLSHAALCNLSEEAILWLLDMGAPLLVPNSKELFSSLECCVWRGYSAALVARFIPKHDGYLPSNTSIGWNALHIALYQNQSHLLDLLWNHFERSAYQSVMFTGEKIVVSVTDMISEFTLTDETLAACLKLTETDVTLHEAKNGSAKANSAGGTLSRKNANNSSGNSNNNNNNGGGNDNNNNVGGAQVANFDVDPSSNLVYSGPLTKAVKVSLFRRYTQVRICSLLRGEQPGEYRWREGVDSTFVELPILSMGVERGSVLVVKTLTGEFRYRCGDHGAAWTHAVQLCEGLPSAV